MSDEEKPKPGEGGWVPTKSTPLAASVAVAICAALGPLAFSQMPRPWGIVVGMVCTGVGTGLAAYYGIKSAGPRS